VILKKRKREIRIDQAKNYIMTLRSPDDQYVSVVQSELSSEIKKAIESLPYLQQQAFVLRYYEELSQADIAKIMNKSQGAVEQLIQRAKSTLKNKLINNHF
jgi:RNA polymerase sigma-70 factor (ECF subfamily)